jgi:tetratricopeptide (TPR) repeat protein
MRKGSFMMKSVQRGITRLLSLLLIAGMGSAIAADNDGFQVDDNAIRHFNAGQTWLSVGQIEAAILEFQIAIRLKPTTSMSAALYNDLGLAYLLAREFPKGIVSLQQAIALNPNFSLYYEHLAEAYQKSGGLQTAIQQLEFTTTQNPDDVQAWYLLGMLYRAAGDQSGSQRALQMFVKMAPHSELADAAKLYLGTSQDSQTGLK